MSPKGVRGRPAPGQPRKMTKHNENDPEPTSGNEKGERNKGVYTMFRGLDQASS